MSKPTLKERLESLATMAEGCARPELLTITLSPDDGPTIREALSLLEEARNLLFRMTWGITEELEPETIAALKAQGLDLGDRLNRALGGS